MKHTICSSAAAVLAITLSMLLAPNAMASREKSYSLTECIAKADIIIIGFVDAKEDIANAGVATVDVLVRLKGTLDSKQLRIVDPYFRSDFRGSPEGPIIVKPGEGYIFFLKMSAAGEPQLFDSCDGVIGSSGPVVLEITQRLRQPK